MMRQETARRRKTSEQVTIRTLSLLALVAAALLGCNEQPKPEPTQSKLSWLGSMYGRHISQTTSGAPKSIEELRKFVVARTTQEELARLGVANADELFVSSRDGKPFVLVTYAKLPPPGTGSPLVVLHEAVGENGQKAVAFLGGGTRLMSDGELSQSIAAAGGKAG